MNKPSGAIKIAIECILRAKNVWKKKPFSTCFKIPKRETRWLVKLVWILTQRWLHSQVKGKNKIYFLSERERELRKEKDFFLFCKIRKETIKMIKVAPLLYSNSSFSTFLNPI